jgi:hypothetical protein
MIFTVPSLHVTMADGNGLVITPSAADAAPRTVTFRIEIIIIMIVLLWSFYWQNVTWIAKTGLGPHWTMPQHNNVNWIKQVFFTSSRVVQYATLEEFSPTQLLADYPFLTDKRTDIVGTWAVYCPWAQSSYGNPSATLCLGCVLCWLNFAGRDYGLVAQDPAAPGEHFLFNISS